MGYLTLFLAAFLSATLLPMGSEALLLYDLSAGMIPWLIWGVATAGNTLGALLNYWLGMKGEHYLERKGYLSGIKMAKARQGFEKWGGWILLLSWMPVVGDPLTFMAGVLQYRFRLFVIIVALSKGVRYAVLIVGYYTII